MDMMRETATLYQKTGERWERTVLRGVFWSATDGRSQGQHGAEDTGSVSVLIPKTVHSVGGWTLKPGDLLVRGECPVEVERSAAKELQGQGEVRTIVTVADRSFGGVMAHWEVTGR